MNAQQAGSWHSLSPTQACYSLRSRECTKRYARTSRAALCTTLGLPQATQLQLEWALQYDTTAGPYPPRLNEPWWKLEHELAGSTQRQPRPPQQRQAAQYQENSGLHQAVHNQSCVQSSSRLPAGTLACTLQPGQAIYVPADWWHATLNLHATTAFVSVFTREDVL